MNKYPMNTRRLEREIVRALLAKLAEAKSPYPYELFKPRRDAYLAQVETLKTTVPTFQSEDGRQ